MRIERLAERIEVEFFTLSRSHTERAVLRNFIHSHIVPKRRMDKTGFYSVADKGWPLWQLTYENAWNLPQQQSPPASLTIGWEFSLVPGRILQFSCHAASSSPSHFQSHLCESPPEEEQSDRELGRAVKRFYVNKIKFYDDHTPALCENLCIQFFKLSILQIIDFFILWHLTLKCQFIIAKLRYL